jgi:hypothetical protein
MGKEIEVSPIVKRNFRLQWSVGACASREEGNKAFVKTCFEFVKWNERRNSARAAVGKEPTGWMPRLDGGFPLYCGLTVALAPLGAVIV